MKGSWWRELFLPERWQRSSNFLSWRTILFSWDHWFTLIRSCWRRAVSSTQEIALKGSLSRKGDRAAFSRVSSAALLADRGDDLVLELGRKNLALIKIPHR